MLQASIKYSAKQLLCKHNKYYVKHNKLCITQIKYFVKRNKRYVNHKKYYSQHIKNKIQQISCSKQQEVETTQATDFTKFVILLFLSSI